jgi:N-methylhydantoinase A
MIRIAFDIGGTFTDFVLHDAANDVTHTLKIPSTPDDPGQAVISGFNELLQLTGTKAEALSGVLHATTIATNAILERKGAATGLITTEGFRDVLIIGRQKRYETYDLYIDKPEPLIPRQHILEVSERLDQSGDVIVELDMASVDRAIDALLTTDRETVAVSLLHAYANPTHELAIRDRINARAPNISVSLSSDVSPKFREYERTNTTVANAYITPTVDRYLSALQSALKQQGYQQELFIMQSSGGLVTPAMAKTYPIRIIESGPAAGVLMAGQVGDDEGYDHVITFDMGGTTAKLGAVDDRSPAVASTFEVGHVRYKKGSGLPINIPAVELLEIGAGGGSIARNEQGMISVGPDSAGAEPGPVCYGQGGTEPTITDANLTLGYIDPEWFNGGTIQLDQDAAAHAISTEIGQPLDLSLGEAAWGIHLIATMNMENALRVVSVERGRDPRAHAMVAFGGAGPLHAARLARAVGIPKVIVPRGAGVGSAVGLLQAAPRIDVSTTRVMDLHNDASEQISDIFAGLEERAQKDLASLGDNLTVNWSRQGYMRYVGQGFEVRVDLPPGPIDKSYAARAIEAFDTAYLKIHKFLDRDARIEVVDWNLAATLPEYQQTIKISPKKGDRRPPRERQAWFPEAGGFTKTAVMDRARLTPEDIVAGPAIVEDVDCTTVILPGDQAQLSEDGHLIITINLETNP